MMTLFFATVYDLILYKAKKENLSSKDVIKHFHKYGINTTCLSQLKGTSFFPEDSNFKLAITSFLELSELEIYLMLGFVPSDYQDSYIENIHKIAALLTPSRENQVPVLIEPYYENKMGKLYNDDCINVMKAIPNEHVDLIFADPPFNLGKMYDPGVEDNLSMSGYINWTYSWLDECIRILKPGGCIYVYNIPKWATYIASYLGHRLTFNNWIAVNMKFSLPIPKRLYPAHYALVSYVKGNKPKVFNNQRIPIETCRHCGGEIKDYGGYKSKMNIQGVNVSDVWNDIYPVRHKNDKNRAYNELPVKLLDRVISMNTNPGDLVFDPFGGSGTTYAVAQLLGRRWMGTEVGNCDIIVNRLEHPEQDKVNFTKVYEEKNHIFSRKVLKLRQKNNLWIPDALKGES